MIQNQHLTDLECALGRLREQGRNWIRMLAAGAGHERAKTESAIESFLKCQTAIEAVGRAIDDERKAVPEETKPKAA
jgi:methylmalonyl-CoA mutase cobalamin-binding subunit